MKSYGLLALIILVLAVAIHGKLDALAEFESEDNQESFDRRFEFQDLKSRSEPDWLLELRQALTQTRREATKHVTQPVLNVTVVHRGIYLAAVKVNFLRNGLQDEFISDSIADGSNKVFLLQNNLSDAIDHVRIRINTVAPEKSVADIQLVHPQDDQLCYVLSGTIFHPVYSLCAPGVNYSR